MNFAYFHIAIVVLLSAILLALVACAKYMALRSPEDIMRAMVKQPLDGLDEFVDRKSQKSDDARFHVLSGGLLGTWKRFHNAACIVRLIQALKRLGAVNRKDVGWMVKKMAAVAFLTATSLPEEGIRVVLSELPHVSARGVATLLAEMEARTQNLLSEHADILDRFRTIV